MVTWSAESTEWLQQLIKKKKVLLPAVPHSGQIIPSLMMWLLGRSQEGVRANIFCDYTSCLSDDTFEILWRQIWWWLKNIHVFHSIFPNISWNPGAHNLANTFLRAQPSPSCQKPFELLQNGHLNSGAKIWLTYDSLLGNLPAEHFQKSKTG